LPVLTVGKGVLNTTFGATSQVHGRYPVRWRGDRQLQPAVGRSPGGRRAPGGTPRAARASHLQCTRTGG